MRQTEQAKKLQYEKAFMKEPITGDGTWLCRRFGDPKAAAKAAGKSEGKWWNGRISFINKEHNNKPMYPVRVITEDYKKAQYAKACAKTPITGDGKWLVNQFSDVKAAKHTVSNPKWSNGRIHFINKKHEVTEYERLTYLNEKNRESFSYIKK